MKVMTSQAYWMPNDLRRIVLASSDSRFVHIIRKLVIRLVFNRNQNVVVNTLCSSVFIMLIVPEIQSQVKTNVKNFIANDNGRQQRHFFTSYWSDFLHI